MYLCYPKDAAFYREIRLSLIHGLISHGKMKRLNTVYSASICVHKHHTTLQRMIRERDNTTPFYKDRVHRGKKL